MQICGGELPYIGAETLDIQHKRIMEEAMNQFHSTRKMGGAEFSTQYAEKLKADIEELYVNFQKHNESKNIFAAARTPAVLFSFMVVLYVLSGVLGMLGLETLANVLNIVMVLALVALCTWAYARYSGEYRDVGVAIDSIVDMVWEKVRPICVTLMSKGNDFGYLSLFKML